MERASFGMLTETSMKETGEMTRQMATESTFMSMEQGMTDTGKTISKTGMAWKPGLTAQNTKVNTKKA